MFALLFGLNEFQVSGTGSRYAVVGGALYSGNMERLIAYPAHRQDSTFTVPAETKMIGESAFENCIGPRKLTLGAKSCTIGNRAFANTSIEKVTMKKGVTKIGKGAFQYCKKLKAVAIPPNIKKLPRMIFFGCSSLRRITIPKKVKSIDPSAFLASGLQSIKVAKGNKYFSSKSGVLFNKKRTTLVFYPPQRKATFYRVPASVKTIRERAFSGPGKLEEVEFLPNLRTIGNRAFQGSGLRSVEIPRTVTKLGKDAFTFGRKLRNVYLKWRKAPKNYRDIFWGGYAFSCVQQEYYYYIFLPNFHIYTSTSGFQYDYYEEADEENYIHRDLGGRRILRFDSAGGARLRARIKHIGDRMGKLPKPTRAGYRFLGWYTKAKGGICVIAQSHFSGATTLHAHWKKK